MGTLDLPPGITADVIIVLYGNSLERTGVAVQLYAQGIASRMVLTGYVPSKVDPTLDTTLIARNYAVGKGVPANAFTLLQTTSTREDALQIAAYVRTNALSRIVVVSDWTHSRRAVCAISAEWSANPPQIFLHPYQPSFTPENWWT